ncbi:MAG: type I secretion system permease/ATPase, partial [Pseudomonadota bacterium]
RELDSLRQFIAGPGPLTFFDAPWTPIYILVIFLTHWALGVTATLGAILLMIIAWTSEATSRQPLIQAGRAAGRSLELAEAGQRNAEAITAMGMLGAYRARWQQSNGEALAWQTIAADRLGTMSSLSKLLRLLLQSLMLAIGAALAIKGEISSGSIVAATIIFGRALAPVEQAIAHWRTFVKARESYRKLDDLLRMEPEPPVKTALPNPKGLVEVTGLRVAAPDTRQLILSNLTFAVSPGQMLAVIGPSASGKSTLARTLVGLWPPYGGSIRLDGARLDQWSQEDLGPHLGYLPQDVELFAGTVRENISRFRDGVNDEDVIAAAQMAHAHDMILALPQGYDSQLGSYGTYLS